MTNKYELSKHRYYELKHWCLQYHDWEKEYRQLDGYEDVIDTTSKHGILRACLYSKIKLVEKVCCQTDNDIWEKLLRTVIGDSKEIPRSSDIYKKFFYLLNVVKD